MTILFRHPPLQLCSPW